MDTKNKTAQDLQDEKDEIQAAKDKLAREMKLAEARAKPILVLAPKDNSLKNKPEETPKEKGDLCKTCDKLTLSLLLLRPSPVGIEDPLKTAKADSVKPDPGLYKGFIPGSPKMSRPVLRLLRDGYIHIYFPKLPASIEKIRKDEVAEAIKQAGNKDVEALDQDPHWVVYRVTQNGDIYPHSTRALSGFNLVAPVSCRTDGHNAFGMRTLGLPKLESGELGTIWIGYSAVLWNARTRAANKSAINEAIALNETTRGKSKMKTSTAMQAVNLAGGSPHTFKPTPEALKQNVLECNANKLFVNGLTDHQYPFPEGGLGPNTLAKQLKDSAAHHPETKGKELAVVLEDRVGYAAELNALRVWRHELQVKFAEQPKYMHPLRSRENVQNMRELYRKQLLISCLPPFENIRDFGDRAFHRGRRFPEKMTHYEFMKRKDSYPKGTSWWLIRGSEMEKSIVLNYNDNKPLTEERIAELRKRGEWHTVELLGAVIEPYYYQKAKAYAEEEEQRKWNADYAKLYDEKKADEWLKNFNQLLEDEHVVHVKKYEADWISAAFDPKTLHCFAQHFDENDPQYAKFHQQPQGIVYKRESDSIFQPASFTEEGASTYLAMLEKELTDISAVPLRAMIGNQKSVIDVISPLLTIDGSFGTRKQVLKIMKKILGIDDSIMARAEKHQWLVTVLAASSAGQIAAFTVAIGVLAEATLKSDKTKKILARIRQYSYVQNMVAEAIKQKSELKKLVIEKASASRLSRFNVPVVVKAHIPIGTGFDLKDAGKLKLTAEHRNAIIELHRQGVTHIPVSILTDSDTIKLANGDLGYLAQHAEVEIGHTGMAATAGWVMGAEEFTKISNYTETQLSNKFNKLAEHLDETLKTINRALHSVHFKSLNSIDGHIAMGGLAFQTIGTWYTYINWLKEADPTKKKELGWALADGVGGMAGASLSLAQVVQKAAIKAQNPNISDDALKLLMSGSGKMTLLTIGVNGFGLAGAWFMIFSNLNDYKKAGRQGYTAIKNLRMGSMVIGVGLGAQNAGLIGFAIADYIAARRLVMGAAGAATEIVVETVAVGRMARLLAGFRIVCASSGVGLALVLLSFAIEGVIWSLTPTKLQAWLKRSYFTKDRADDAFKHGYWEAEEAKLEEALGISKETEL